MHGPWPDVVRAGLGPKQKGWARQHSAQRHLHSSVRAALGAATLVKLAERAEIVFCHGTAIRPPRQSFERGQTLDGFCAVAGCVIRAKNRNRLEMRPARGFERIDRASEEGLQTQSPDASLLEEGRG